MAESDLPNSVQPGDPILASHYSKVLQIVKQFDLGPGQFSGGGFRVRRRLNGGTGGINSVRGEAVGPVAATDASFDIDQIKLLNGQLPEGVEENSADTITLLNTYDFVIDDNGLVWAVQDETEDAEWEAKQAKCPAAVE